MGAALLGLDAVGKVMNVEQEPDDEFRKALGAIERLLLP